jgi:DNA modification methylase
MRLIFNESNVRIYHGDAIECVSKLPELVDITVTSPPYNTLGSRIPKVPTGKHANNGWMKKVRAIGYEDDMPEMLYQKWMAYVVAMCMEKSKGLVWINHKVRYRDRVAVHPTRYLDFPIYSEIVWARSGSLALNCKRYAPSHEGIWGFGQPHWWDDNGNKQLSVWKIPQVMNRTDHPCPYPEELARRLIESSCPPGGVVLDPFAGSFTTGIAAVKSGRGFVGVEKNLVWAKSGAKRMREFLRQNVAVRARRGRVRKPGATPSPSHATPCSALPFCGMPFAGVLGGRQRV